MEALLRRLELLEAAHRKTLSEREGLLARICELEDRVEDLTWQLHKPKTATKDPEPREPVRGETPRDGEVESWLFYCAFGTSTAHIQSVLDFAEGSAFELQVRSLGSEVQLWRSLLALMNPLDQSLPAKLPALRKLASVHLSSTCHSELLIIMRGIPSAADPMFQQVLPLVITLAEYVNAAWTEVEAANPELLGRIALVLESEEEIKVLTVDKGDTRTSLYVERL